MNYLTEGLHLEDEITRRTWQDRPDPIHRYLDLTAQRPDMFTPGADIPLVMDPVQLRAFAAETGKPVGLVFDNRP